MKFVSKISMAALVLVGLAVSFVGCQKEDQNSTVTPIKSITSGVKNEPAIIDGKSYVFNRSKNTNKGLLLDFVQDAGGDTSSAIQTTQSDRYKTIKVVRPNGKVFWIMVENLRYSAASGSWLYTGADVKTYGRLYNWPTAKSLETQVYMKLPRYNKTTLQPTNLKMTYFGHLPTIQDMRDMLETTSIGNLPSNGNPDRTNVNGFYYDAFLGGIEWGKGNNSAAYHTLAGMRDNIQYAPGNTEFIRLNSRGYYWLSDGDASSHYPLTIYDNTTIWTAFINCGDDNGYGHSVRFVFEPDYL